MENNQFDKKNFVLDIQTHVHIYVNENGRSQYIGIWNNKVYNVLDFLLSSMIQIEWSRKGQIYVRKKNNKNEKIGTQHVRNPFKVLIYLLKPVSFKRSHTYMQH